MIKAIEIDDTESDYWACFEALQYLEEQGHKVNYKSGTVFPTSDSERLQILSRLDIMGIEHY